MKRGIIFFIFAVIAMSSVSAELICTNGTIISDSEEVNIVATKSVNGLLLTPTHADEIAALRRFTAGFVVDSAVVRLSDKNLSANITLYGNKKYKVTLVNATNLFANIKIDTSPKRIEKGDTETVKNLKVVLLNSDSSLPNIFSAVLVVGVNQIFLSNDAHPSEKIKFANETYISELISASDVQITLKVSKCDKGEIKEIISNSTIQASNSSNVEINKTINKTQQPELETAKEKVSFFRRILRWIDWLFS